MDNTGAPASPGPYISHRLPRADAELFYDGRIPPGAVDDTLPSRFVPAAPVRVGRVIEKPASIRRRMAAALATLANGGRAITEDDVKRFGFSSEEIRAHGADAIREMLIAHPTLPSIEWAA